MSDLTTALTTGLSAVTVAAHSESVSAGTGNVLAHHGCERLHILLEGLSAMFPEREELAAWIIIFTNTILNNPEMEVWAMKRWHKEMTEYADGSKRVPNLYVKTRERAIDDLLDSGVWILEEINARSMYFDPDVDDTDRETICKHFEKINACAEAMSAVPEDMMQGIMACVRSMDQTQPITPDTTFSMLQKIIGCKPADLMHDSDAMERLVGWSQQLIESMNNGGLQALQSIAGEAALASGTGMPNMAEISKLMQSELMGCTSILSSASEGGGIDTEQIMNLASMFSNITGGGGVGGAGSV